MATSQSDLQRRDALIRRFLPLADGLAGRFHHRYGDLLERDDLIQVARLGLVKSAARVTDERTAPAYIKRFITGELSHHLRDRAHLVRLPARSRAHAPWRHLSLDAPFPSQQGHGSDGGGDERQCLLDQLAAASTGEAAAHTSAVAENLLGLLAPRQAQVLELTVLQGQTLRQAAHCLGVSPMTVSRMRSQAIATLRQAIGAPQEIAA